jgi:multidrug efflux pump subunit AcrA (membrane-fusion protein)
MFDFYQLAAFFMLTAFFSGGAGATSLPELMQSSLASHPSVRGQEALSRAAQAGVDSARWQFFPSPSVGVEQVNASRTDISYGFGDKNVSTLRLQQPVWTGGRLTAGLEKAQANDVLSLAAVTSRLGERQSVLDHTTLNSPVDGIVKFLRVTTIGGGVLRAGEELMQISPSDELLIIEGKVTPTDIGQLHPGLPVSVKLDAFDYSVYGALDGVLTYVSPDTLSETGPNGQSQTFFRVHVKLNPQQNQNPKAGSIIVKLGMTASLDIRTGTRSVMQYIAKPVFKTFSGALSER